MHVIRLKQWRVVLPSQDLLCRRRNAGYDAVITEFEIDFWPSARLACAPH